LYTALAATLTPMVAFALALVASVILAKL
jgi:hypothetical protein